MTGALALPSAPRTLAGASDAPAPEAPPPEAGTVQVRRPVVWLGALCLAAWAWPAVAGLAADSWTSEAGSLGPLVLGIGCWLLVRELRASASLARPGSLAIVLPAGLVVAAVYFLAVAINMVPLICVATWAGLALALYACAGWPVVRACWFPLAFLALVTPLPYTLSLPLTLALRDFVAHWATAIAAGFGLDVAVDSAAVFVDQFELAVENACAGLNSTVSLVAIGLMFAYLQRARGWPSVLSVALLALPIAMIANVLRVVVLLFAVHWGGARVLDTPLHPISGLVSFSLALLLLVLATGALDRIRAEARR